ncbi:MAG TPA: winged helix-turn-helix domain-containing protein [Vicinamibacterales bacterium]|jgi:serine/threonine-protein kinase
MRIRFGPFAFDPESRLLWRDDTEIALPPRVLGVLEALLDRAGQVVARQDLLDRVWKDAFVTDTSLAEAVSFLRQALGDDPQSPRYVQTVHRRGYRFLPTPTPGSDRGQTGVRPGSDHLRPTSAQPAAVDWQLIPWSVAALCAGLAVAAVWHDASQRPPDPPAVARLELRTSPGTTFDRQPQPIAIAPDGRAIAWSACDNTSGRCALYLRTLDHPDAHALSGTEDGHSPVFSPDGRWIAFFADGSLKRIAASGGAPATIAPAPDPAGAAWGADGRIAFAPSAAGGISVVDDRGDTPQPLTEPDAERGELRHRFPAWVADAGLIFTVATDPNGSVDGSLAALGTGLGTRHPLRGGVRRAAPVGRSYLLLATGDGVQAATFDEPRLLLTGATDAVAAPAGDGPADFAAGGDALAVVRPAERGQRTWADGGAAPALDRLTSIAIAPDSRRAAGVDLNGDIWIADLESNGLTRLTFGGGHAAPVWTTDGQRLLFSARSPAAFHVFSRVASDASDAPSPLAGAPSPAFPTSVAADGRVALTVYTGGHTRVGIARGGAGDTRILTDGPFDEAAAVFSPDGRWLALESTASGRREVMVRSTADGRSTPISRDGGTHPRWSADGHSVYYTSGRRLLRSAFSQDSSARAAAAEVILDRPDEAAIEVAPSGRILVERRAGADTALVALQWLRELRERLPLPVNAPR